MNKKLYITLFIISIVFLSIGGTLALATSTMNGINITQIKSGNLTLSIDGGDSIDASFVPAKCTSENAIKKKIRVDFKNTSGGEISFNMGLAINSISDSFKRETMRYALTTDEDSCTTNILAGGSFKEATAGTDMWLIKNTNVDYNRSYTKTEYYYLYIWLDETETEYIEGNISVKIKGTVSNEPNLPIDVGYNDGSATNTLYYQIKSNADTTTKIDFSKTSEQSNTNGIYTTTNTENGVPVYYYRGNVDNHVFFANYCWRIIRTTETGGVKLIYDGIPISGSDCSNMVVGDSNYIFSGAVNYSCYGDNFCAGYMYNDNISTNRKNMKELTGSIMFGNDIYYDDKTNQYVLKDTYTLTDTNNWENEYTTIAGKYHYTCFTTDSTCTNVNYMTGLLNSGSVYYLTLDNGKDISDILDETWGVYSNTGDSTIKSTIDNWYEENISEYSSTLEDTVFCNDLSFDINDSYWNKDYGLRNNFPYFGSYLRLYDEMPSLICPRQVDKFTINTSNGNGALKYPVGLITADEIVYAGGKLNTDNTTYYLYKEGSFDVTMSPYSFDKVFMSDFYASDFFNGAEARPVISLKSGTVLSGGNGTSTSPYIVE